MAATLPTVREQLSHCNIHDLADCLKKLKFDEFIAGQIPRWVTRTGVANSATQILYTEDGQPASPVGQPFQVMAVTDGSDTPLAIVKAGVGAGEVSVNYDADGVPTLVFNAALTSYKVKGCPIPTGWSTILAGVLG